MDNLALPLSHSRFYNWTCRLPRRVKLPWMRMRIVLWLLLLVLISTPLAPCSGDSETGCLTAGAA